jgi:hypothetical protein
MSFSGIFQGLHGPAFSILQLLCGNLFLLFEFFSFVPYVMLLVSYKVYILVHFMFSIYYTSLSQKETVQVCVFLDHTLLLSIQ